MYDKRRRPRRDAAAADQKKKNLITSIAPLCLEEDPEAGELVNVMIFMGNLIGKML